MINKNIKLIDIPNVLNSFLSDVECSGLSFDRRLTPLKSKLELRTYVDENDKYYQIELVVPSFSKNDISIRAECIKKPAAALGDACQCLTDTSTGKKAF